MCRSALARMLTAAFLVALPVTGAGPCPYCPPPVTCLPTADPPPTHTAAPQKCKCCHASHDHADGGQPKGEGQKPAPPGGTPCDHNFTADAALANPSGEWSKGTWKLWGANTVADAGCQSAARPASDPMRYAAGPLPAPPLGRRALRYSCSFRC